MNESVNQDKHIKILISGSYKIGDSFGGLEEINRVFSLEESKLYFSETIEIIFEGVFIPSKVIIFLGHHLFKYESKGKNIIVKFKKDSLCEYINKCGIVEFINTGKVSSDKISESVALPFSRISTTEDLEEYFNNFKDRILISGEYTLIDHIGELHFNSKEHGNTQDIYIMGQKYPTTRKIDISIYDAGEGMLKEDLEGVVDTVYNKYCTDDFYTTTNKNYGHKIFFIIMCVCTQFSTKGPTNGGWGLRNLSEYLAKNNGIIQVATGKYFLELIFKRVCSKLDMGDLDIKVTELSVPIEGTYISFTSSF